VELLKAIEEEAEKRCREYREKADAEVERIERETEAQIRSARESARHETIRKLRREGTVLEAEAETKVQRERAVAKNEILEKTMKAAGEKLAAFVASSEYPEVFRRLAEEVLEEMKEDITITVRPEDEKLARETLQKLGARDFEISADGAFSGGLVAASRDGRARVVNTFESRFEEVREEAVPRLGPKLFG